MSDADELTLPPSFDSVKVTMRFSTTGGEAKIQRRGSVKDQLAAALTENVELRVDHVLDMSSAEAPCVKRRVVESADAVHFHVGTTRIRSRHAVHGSWTALAGPAPLRRRRRAEMLVGGHVRYDCERHGM